MSEGFIRCPECKRALPADTEVCTNCGYKLNAPEVAPNSTKTCRYCGEEILAVAVKCKHCGSSLTETPVRNGGNKLSVESGSVARSPKGLIAAVIASLILAITNPSQPDFNEFVLERISKSTENQANTGLNRFLSGVAVMAVSNMTDRTNLILFSLYDVDVSMVKAFNPNVQNRKFLGVLGQFIPLSTSICDYIDTKGTNCEDSKEAAKHESTSSVESDPAPAANLPASDSDQLPSQEAAFRELFGVFDQSGKVKTAADKLTSLWFVQSFKYGNDNIHVKFFKSQTLDASGEVDSCHACGVDIGAITYKKVNDEWRVVSKQRKLGVAGQYGDVSEEDPEVVKLSSDVMALLFDSKAGGMGYYYEGKMLLSFANGTWHDAGVINTGADNSAVCEDPEMAVACWRYIGEISVVAGENLGHPDILVTRTGTEAGGKPAKNVTYSFKDGAYAEIR